ncbi:p-hydroxybenzoic acid efflux pump operon protein AaeX [Escherichia coli]
MPFSAATDAENNNACSLYTTKVNMSLFPVIVVFGLSFPPIFFNCFYHWRFSGWCAGYLCLPTGIYDFVWHPALFNTALYCCLFYLISRLFV